MGMSWVISGRRAAPGLRFGIAAALAGIAGPVMGDPFFFTPGDIVVTVEGNGSNTASGGTAATGNTANPNTYMDGEASPLTLYEFNTSGVKQTPVATLTLPTVTVGANSVISGEYGSSSEGTLQRTGDGHALTLAGYGIGAFDYNSKYDVDGNGTALAQSCNWTGCSGAPQVPRVIAVIGADGTVDTSTVLNNIASTNNPRSVWSPDGKSFYISGQASGNAGDPTGGTFYIPAKGPGQTPVAVTGADATGKTVYQDTREVTVVNNTLYVSSGTKQGSGNTRGFVGTLGSPPATGLYQGGAGPTQLPNFGSTSAGRINLGATNGNSLNANLQINLSPENFFFANATTLYVADDGKPKNTSASSGLGDGGLQKWSLDKTTGMWKLDYTLFDGLGLVANTNSHGISGLYGLTGQDITVNGVDMVELFATSYTLGDTDPSYLFGITDFLLDTADGSLDGKFIELADAPADTTFKGVAFAPIPAPEPATLALLGVGLLGFAAVRRGRGLKENGAGRTAASR